MSLEKKTGIVAYGVHVPRYRIKSATIAEIWGMDPNDVKGLCDEKSVPDLDEDVITLSVEAARNAVDMAGSDFNRKGIGAIYTGSESHPYAVKPTSTAVAQALRVPNVTAVDTEFACKAGTAAIQMCYGLVKSDVMQYGIAIGSDTSQGRPGDALEYTASAGAAAFIVGKDALIAELEDTFSYTRDFPDFWRREHATYPSHGGRFTGLAYFSTIERASKGLLEKMGTKPEDYDYCVFHSPNVRFPQQAAKRLGFKNDQVKDSLIVKKIGNTYSGSSPLALAAVLDIAKPNDRIFMCSYGSGAGSDAFSWRVTDEIVKKRGKSPTVQKFIDKKRYLNYGQYVRHRKKLKGFD